MRDVGGFPALFCRCLQAFVVKETLSEDYELRAPASWYRKLRVKAMLCIPEARCGGRWHGETLVSGVTSRGRIQRSGWA